MFINNKNEKSCICNYIYRTVELRELGGAPRPVNAWNMGQLVVTWSRFSVRVLNAFSGTGPKSRENVPYAFWGVTENLSLGVFLSEKLPRCSGENVRGGQKIARLDSGKCRLLVSIMSGSLD